LKDKILDEMLVDHSDSLEKNFSLAKKFVNITATGKADIKDKTNFGGKEQIILYLIGKLYAKEAGFTQYAEASNKELMDELGIPQGSLLPWLKSLRDLHKIKQTKREKVVYHTIPLNNIEKELNTINKKSEGQNNE